LKSSRNAAFAAAIAASAMGSRHGRGSAKGFLFFFFGCVLRIPAVLFGVVLGFVVLSSVVFGFVVLGFVVMGFVLLDFVVLWFVSACCAVERECAVCVLRVDAIAEIGVKR
jgi:hypothetical protein